MEIRSKRCDAESKKTSKLPVAAFVSNCLDVKHNQLSVQYAKSHSSLHALVTVLRLTPKCAVIATYAKYRRMMSIAGMQYVTVDVR